MEGGAADEGVEGLEAVGVGAGLSQVEKKSSESPPLVLVVGVEELAFAFGADRSTPSK